MAVVHEGRAETVNGQTRPHAAQRFQHGHVAEIEDARTIARALSTSMVRSLNGMRCSLAAFILAAGITHTLPVRSISDQTALIISLVLAAVRMVSSSALALTLSRWRSSAMNAGKSA